MSSRLRRGIAGGLTALGMSAIAFVGGWEGLKLRSYKDVVGVWTACYGETKNIGPGMVFTKPECDEMFARRLVEFETRMRACLKAPDAIPDKAYLAFLSLSYNIGSGAFCKSTLAKRANAGDLRAACMEILKWNRAGGIVWKGLTNRRRAENKLCLEGLA